MFDIKILDCTLRDGGYCNQWTFGAENIKKIIDGVVESGIEIVECGFLTEKHTYDINSTRFNTIESINSFISSHDSNTMFVAMMNYGEFCVESLDECSNQLVSGIRVAFHKMNLDDAINTCMIIKSKGYKVFVQPMVSICYTDEEFVDLITKVNKLEPYAFYIVDSFGSMKTSDIVRLTQLVTDNLKKSIRIGFHSHNNMQLAYSNAQTLLGLCENRPMIVDASIYGMGRGAGNLNTEILVEYINECYRKDYRLKPILKIIDDILDGFYKKNNWGYSLPNYISAKHCVHPNYAAYLDDKRTINIDDIDNIISLIEHDKKYVYDKNYIEELYSEYLSSNNGIEDKHNLEFKATIENKNIVLIAPGKSLSRYETVLNRVIKDENVVCISINFYYPESDFVFLSNLRRYRELEKKYYSKSIVTSNIICDEYYLKVKYSDLVNDVEYVRDNAGLMAIKFLKSCGVNKIMLAGFDGYSHDTDENYVDEDMRLVVKKGILDAINFGMGVMLNDYKKEIEFSFITPSKYM